ncbi:MAG: DUF4097 family beta strand repeat-containing protein, partial [Anaerovoracaceae bacterium]
LRDAKINGMYLGEHLQRESVEVEPFTQVSVQGKYGDIRLISGDAYRVEFTAKDSGEGNPIKPEIKVENGKLTITEKDGPSGTLAGINLAVDERDDEDIIIYCPAGVDLSAVEIQSELGDVEIEQVGIKTLNAVMAYGDMNLRGATIETATIKMDKGDLEGENLTNSGLNVTLDYGDVDLVGRFTGETNITTSNGDIDLQVNAPKEEYNYNLAVDLGELSINDRKGEAPSVQIGVANTINLTTTRGDVELDFIR